MTTVGQLTSVLKRCTMLISNDSGPVHIAAGLKIPVVSIFTRNQPGINPERWKPLGVLSRYVSVPLDEKPSFEKAGTAESIYLDKISPNEVLAAVKGLVEV